MIVKIVFYWFLCGFWIGYIIDMFTSLELQTNKFETSSTRHHRLMQTSFEEVKKIRILCFVSTMPKSHSTRAVHIVQTWAKHCDKILFFSSITDENVGALGFNVKDSHQTIWGKVKLMVQHIYKHFLNEYDWFLKCDDDTFLITHNLRYLLSYYSKEDPIYFGYKFNTTKHKKGFFSGGAGYAMSRQAVRIFVERSLTNKEFYRKYTVEPGCHIETDKRYEDWDMGLCLEYYDVQAGDSRDFLKRDRFFAFWPEERSQFLVLESKILLER